MSEIRHIHEGREFPRRFSDADSPESVVPSSELTFSTRRIVRTEANRQAVAEARNVGEKALLNQSVHLFNDLVETGLELSGGDPYRVALISQVCARFLDRAEKRAVAATSEPGTSQRAQWFS
ncbi:hypothetical protein [Streptomyces prunicolor]|uniref:hypothetical protein n=1 Tax=Streptomyces prunicolor TaxID=67348 RepID=UPI0033CFBF75